MTLLSSFVTEQLLVSLAGDVGGNGGGGAFPGDTSVMVIASLLVGIMGVWPTRLWVCGVSVSFSSGSMISSSKC